MDARSGEDVTEAEARRLAEVQLDDLTKRLRAWLNADARTPLELRPEDAEPLGELLNRASSYPGLLRAHFSAVDLLRLFAAVQLDYEQAGGSTRERRARLIRSLPRLDAPRDRDQNGKLSVRAGWEAQDGRERQSRRWPAPSRLAAEYVYLTTGRGLLIDELAVQAGLPIEKAALAGATMNRCDAVKALAKRYNKTYPATLRALGRARKKLEGLAAAHPDGTKAARILERMPPLPQAR